MERLQEVFLRHEKVFLIYDRILKNFREGKNAVFSP